MNGQRAILTENCVNFTMLWKCINEQNYDAYNVVIKFKHVSTIMVHYVAHANTIKLLALKWSFPGLSLFSWKRLKFSLFSLVHSMNEQIGWALFEQKKRVLLIYNSIHILFSIDLYRLTAFFSISVYKTITRQNKRHNGAECFLKRLLSVRIRPQNKQLIYVH